MKRATIDSHLITSYIGSFKLLKKISSLWSYFQQFSCEEYVDLSIEDSIEEILEYTEGKELKDDGISLQENVNKLDPLVTCQTITQYAFSLISTPTLD